MKKITYIIISLVFLSAGIANAEIPASQDKMIQNLEINTLNYHANVTNLAKIVEHNFKEINNNTNLSDHQKDLYLQFYAETFNIVLKHMALYKEMKHFTISLRNTNSMELWLTELEKFDRKVVIISKELAIFNNKMETISPEIKKIKPQTPSEYKKLSMTWQHLQKTNKYIIQIANQNIKIAKYSAKRAKTNK